MRDSNYNPTARTARKAAELWKNMLRGPKFDNGDTSLSGGMATVLAGMIPVNTTDELLGAFADKLAERIMTPSETSPDYYNSASLHVDYGPDLALSECADAVGLKCQFPWKTNMWVRGDMVSVSYGYGAEAVNYYALDNGKWLVTTLSGSDVEKIKKFVTDGTLPEFTVE